MVIANPTTGDRRNWSPRHESVSLGLQVDGVAVRPAKPGSLRINRTAIVSAVNNGPIPPSIPTNAARQTTRCKTGVLFCAKRCILRTAIFSRLPQHLLMRITVGEMGLLESPLHLKYTRTSVFSFWCFFFPPVSGLLTHVNFIPASLPSNVNQPVYVHEVSPRAPFENVRA